MKKLYLIISVVAALFSCSCKQKATTLYPELQSKIEPIPVDLGLSVEWSLTNLGTDSETGRGCMFFYGSTTPTKKKSDTTYPYDPPTEYSIAGDPEHDPATKYWGENWRMPTDAQFQELIDKCTWKHEYFGFTITGPNGNYIFLPDVGYYWTATTNRGGTPICYGISGQKVFKDGTSYPGHGFGIRPVYVSN